MIKLTVKDLLDNCDAKLLIGDKEKEINECFVNSKDVTLGSTFFGIKGENIDGSLFYKEAFNNGADICVINKIYDLDLNGYDDKTVIIASDTLKVLHKLAAYKRSLFKGKVIAITGSVGKTSTKEILYNMLKNKYKVLKTLGNQNSQIGLPLNILRLADEEVLVLEAGMNNLGHIHNLSLIAKPDIAVITNVLTSHIGILKTRENILKAKLEIIDGMNGGVLIINNDNDMLNSWFHNANNKDKIITFGIENESNVMARNIKEDINTNFSVDDIKDISLKGPKDYIYNFLAAYTAAKNIGIEDSDIMSSLNELHEIPHRLQLINIKDNITLIDDSYNASLESTTAALKYLNTFKTRKVAVIADILELGDESKKTHQKIADKIIENNIDLIITIGKYSNHINKTLRKKGFKKNNMKHFKNEMLSRKYIRKIIKEGDTILIKGSNGMNLINLIEYLKGE